MNYKETELTLGLPGGGDFGSDGRFISAVAGFGGCESSTKLGFAETGDAGFDRESSTSKLKPPRRFGADDDKYESSAKGTGEVVVGWPPVRSSRKASTLKESRKYVKVGADGAPYLRKLDLEMYTTYKELLTALQKLFTSFTINGKYMEEDCRNQKMVMKHAENGTVEYNDYVVTYEDKDGDWMLVGDVPWKMFKESCKRIRVMKQMLQSSS